MRSHDRSPGEGNVPARIEREDASESVGFEDVLSKPADRLRGCMDASEQTELAAAEVTA